jgi:hypothetical protein
MRRDELGDDGSEACIGSPVLPELAQESAVSNALSDKGAVICPSRVSCTISFIRKAYIVQYYEGMFSVQSRITYFISMSKYEQTHPVIPYSCTENTAL